VWLPETAVDEPVLRMLDTVGFRFTIVAPHQVSTAPAPGSIGRVAGYSTRLVVYDGPISHALAFGSALGSAESLADQFVSALDSGLVVAATDLETFGHHHRFSERAVGHLLFGVAEARGWRTGGLGPAVRSGVSADVGAIRASAWSCAHGYERWRSNCGCSTDGVEGSQQRWRGPLRAVLNVLRDQTHEVFARRGDAVFFDPWAARDAYGDVLADPSAHDRFVEEHVRPMASVEEASILLASQEATLASFTSCAWFFADFFRPEAAIVLQEAARSAELLARLGESLPLDAALELLDTPDVLEGGSRVPDSIRTGRDVWDWALHERSGIPSAGEVGLRRWDSMSPVVALVTTLTRNAVGGSVADAQQAADVVDLVHRAGDHHLFTVAQQSVYNALVGRGRDVPEHLVSLGAALGLSVDAVTAR
jgi:hypothetical protein